MHVRVLKSEKNGLTKSSLIKVFPVEGSKSTEAMLAMP